MRSLRPLLACSLAGLLTAAALPGLAQQGAVPPPAPSSAVDLRDKARAALGAGDTAGACVLFEQSYQAAKAGGGVSADDALFDLADCHAKLGKNAMAAAEFGQVGGTRVDEARQRAAALQPAPAAGPAGAAGAPPSSVEPAPPPPDLPPVETLTGGEPPTRLGDFMDTRLSWTFGSDDVLHTAGQANPLSQNFSIGNRPQYRLFFDDLDTRFSGRENITHLGLYKKMPGFIKRLDTEAAANLRFNFSQLGTQSANLNAVFYDAGSFINLFYHTGDDPHGKTGLGLTLWPIDTDRFRLGYLYALSWGGTGAGFTNTSSIFPRIQGLAPGAKLQYTGDGWDVFVGFKTASIVETEHVLEPGTAQVQELHLAQANVGLLAGGGVDITDFFRVDVNGGFFQQGTFDFPDVAGGHAWTAGGSARVLFHHKDMATPMSIDFLLYRNDPNKPAVIFKPEVYTPGKTTWLVSAEYDTVFQHLKDFDVAGATKIQQGQAGALQATIKSSYFRGSLTGLYRDLNYVEKNQPGFFPFETNPAAGKTTPEFFVAAAADYYFRAPRLTLGIGAGVQVPATFSSTDTDTASAPIDRTVVVRQQGNLAVLPAGRTAVPIIQTRLSLKWDISRIVSATVWVQWIRDNNYDVVEQDPTDGTSLYEFITPDFLGMGTSVQARF